MEKENLAERKIEKPVHNTVFDLNIESQYRPMNELQVKLQHLTNKSKKWNKKNQSSQRQVDLVYSNVA